MDGFKTNMDKPVVVIAATNLPKELDPVSNFMNIICVLVIFISVYQLFCICCMLITSLCLFHRHWFVPVVLTYEWRCSF